MEYDFNELYILMNNIEVEFLDICVYTSNFNRLIKKDSDEGIYTFTLKYYIDDYIEVNDDGPYYTGLDFETAINIVNYVIDKYPTKKVIDNTDDYYYVRLRELTTDDVNYIYSQINREIQWERARLDQDEYYGLNSRDD